MFPTSVNKNPDDLFPSHPGLRKSYFYKMWAAPDNGTVGWLQFHHSSDAAFSSR